MADPMKIIIEIDNLTNEQAADIAITFFESGSYGWWVKDSAYDALSWCDADIPDGFAFYSIRTENHETGNPSDNPTIVTPELIKLGFLRLFKDRHWSSGVLASMSREDWTGYIDADIADTIMQYAIYGDIIYG